jgi:adenylate cyclase
MTTDAPGILIVDDNEDNRYTLQLMLETDGHERIASAAGGNEAIALIEKEKFSLVLLDLMMPDLNGDEVLKVIKSDPDKRDIPVVMISADTNADKVSQCIELGADDYLSKPFNPAILRARIGAALRRAGRAGRGGNGDARCWYRHSDGKRRCGGPGALPENNHGKREATD